MTAALFERIRTWALPGRARVLLAEDDDEIRAMLATALRHEGHDVVEASDGDCLLLYLEHAIMDDERTPGPDLIISDLRMPGHTGMELLAAVRQAEIDVPVVLITAFGTDQTRAEAFELGASLFEKPLDLDRLLLTVRSLVR